jgi:hypothetical membrane protein
MNAKGNMALQQIGAWAGIIAPILFTVLVIVESLLRSGYSQIYNYISDLGVGPYAIIQNANFIILGLLSLVFAFGFGRTLAASSGRRARSVVGIIVVFGLGTMFAGASLLFIAYFAHTLATFIAFFTIIAAQSLTWRSLKNSDGKTWGRYRAYSLISGLLSLVLLFVFFSTLSTAYHGATERVFVAVPLIWIEVTGIKLHSLSKRTSPMQTPTT